MNTTGFAAINGKSALAIGVCALLLSGAVSAANVPWIGTADYTQATSAVGDEDTVGPFDNYDFGLGATVINGAANAAVGDVLTGTYQSYVSSHENIAGGGGTVAAPNLNSTGVGDGYELTVTASFTETITSVANGVTSFTINDGGSFDLWFDTTPDFNFNSDTGFSGDDSILSGTIVGGGGAFVDGILTGFTSIDIEVSDYNADIFEPDTIVVGNSVFTLQLSNPSNAAFLAGITSVNGNDVEIGDLLLAADGNLALQAVPVPAAVWLFGTAVIGLVGFSRRKSQVVTA